MEGRETELGRCEGNGGAKGQGSQRGINFVERFNHRLPCSQGQKISDVPNDEQHCKTDAGTLLVSLGDRSW